MDLIELTDGTIVGFWAIAAQCTNGWPTNDGECDTNDAVAGYRYETTLPPYGWNVALRSESDGDQGTWTMHRLDHNPARLGGPLDSNGDFSVFHKSGGCEVYAAPTSDGGWLAFVRPCYHAYTDWFTRAQPGGATWPPLSRAAYPMFASSMLRTKAGVLVHAGQFPIVSLQVSWDDGFSWRFFDIDYNGATGGNGQIAEVAPDVLMYTYDGECGCSRFCFQKPDKAFVAQMASAGRPPVATSSSKWAMTTSRRCPREAGFWHPTKPAFCFAMAELGSRNPIH